MSLHCDSYARVESNIEFDSRSLINPSSNTPLDLNTISAKNVTNPSTSN